MSATLLAPEYHTVNVKARMIACAVVREGPQPRRNPKPMRDPAAVAALLRALIGAPPQEVFAVVALNAKHDVLAVYEVSRGTLNSSLVDPRAVFGPALRLQGVASIILGHNHPSGDPTPSDLSRIAQTATTHYHAESGDGYGKEPTDED